MDTTDAHDIIEENPELKRFKGWFHLALGLVAAALAFRCLFLLYKDGVKINVVGIIAIIVFIAFLTAVAGLIANYIIGAIYRQKVSGIIRSRFPDIKRADKPSDLNLKDFAYFDIICLTPELLRANTELVPAIGSTYLLQDSMAKIVNYSLNPRRYSAVMGKRGGIGSVNGSEGKLLMAELPNFY